MADDSDPREKRMRLRYAGTCRVCGVALPARAEAIYERATRTVRCTTHEDPVTRRPSDEPEVDVGTPGASARREFERRKALRENKIRTAHPKLGGLIHALTTDPQSTRAWDVGAIGEELLGRRLNELVDDSLLVLHDRCIPGSRANIDHLVVTATGVYVVDAKKYGGRPRLKIEGGLLRPRVEKLLVGSRNCTRLVDSAIQQVAVVRALVDDSIQVHGVLCFVDADWPLIGGSFMTRGVHVLKPKKLYPKLRSAGPLDVETIAATHRALATALPRS